MKKIIMFFLFIFLFVGCTNKEYTIQFNSNGGSIIEQQSIKSGETIIKPIAPTKEGHFFLRWELNNKEYNFKDKISDDIVLNAIWKINADVKKYQIKFNNGESNDTVEVIAGQIISEPAEPTKAGSTFIGWYLEGDSEPFNFDTIVNCDFTLTAKYKDGPSLINGGSNQIIYVTNLSVTVQKTKIKKKETMQIESNIMPSNASNKNLKFKSSNEKIATISDTGLVTGIKTGEVTITVEAMDDSGLNQTITLNVVSE